MKTLFFNPVFHQKIWGGTKLHDYFGYTLPTNKIGESWAISAHPRGASIVKNKPFTDKSLHELWQKYPELFGYPKENVFPLLTKILDASTDLSVQVHPDDVYARKHESGELGKTECWYIIDCKPGAELIYGHNAKSKEQFTAWVKSGKWDHLFRKVTVKPGDFFYVPSGTIHAIGAGFLLLETQQSSDITYRVYDYERVDTYGKKRTLHHEQASNVTTIPHRDSKVHTKVTKRKNVTVTTFIVSTYFSVYKYEVDGEAHFLQKAPYTLVSILNGKARLTIDKEKMSIQKGDHFLLLNTVTAFTISGKIEAIISTPPAK